ncbi:D-sedoheptulose-7-phosphate isomerase [Schlesneria paludicola]|uniref:D-sedoheptulose-7-phosphate isomerase n=1 Tax=Schlesneria paludicola TaxID=360056 RepID=UPI00029A7823|nr:D-sedoheptulose 7-phosphate isomerase [Schlesneria paludicola]
MTTPSAVSPPLENWLDAQFAEHASVLSATRLQCGTVLLAAVEACAACISQGGKILFCGNGGSAADAQHLATELTIRYKTNRLPIAGIALTTDTSALTACGNDLGFDEIFSRQVHALGRPGDVLIGISTSGNSQNVILAAEKAAELQIQTIAFVGGSGGKLADLSAIALKVPSRTTARIQEMHIFLGHLLCELLEQRLGLVEESSHAAAR